MHKEISTASGWNLLKAIIAESGNSATSECKRDVFGEHPNHEKASGQIETDMDSWDRV